MAYVPTPAPTDAAQLQAWIQRELLAISQAWEQPQQFLMLNTLYEAPKKVREGMVVKADGTTWNPGSGAGFYGHRGGAWHFLG